MFVPTFDDYLPEGPGPLVYDPPSSAPLHAQPGPEGEQPEGARLMPLTDPSSLTSSPEMRRKIKTKKTSFGVYRVYRRAPRNIPDDNVDVADLMEVDSGVATNASKKDCELADLGLCKNISTLNFLNWFWNKGTLKSINERDRLVTEVFHAPEGFNPLDVQVPHLHKLDKHFAGQLSDGADHDPGTFCPGDGWIERVVQLAVPDGVRHPGGEKDAPTFSVPRYYHRKLTEVIKEVFSSPAAKKFHFEGYKQLWVPPGNPSAPPQRIFDEIYCSDSFLAAEKEILALPSEPNCDLPRAVAGMMFSSDGLQLANFGTASLWPGYLQWANQSKWERAKPSLRSTHHVSYFPKVNHSLHIYASNLIDEKYQLPDSIQDFLELLPKLSSSAKAAILTHLNRELFQSCWEYLLDDDFLHAWVHGIVVECGDGVTRRLYPRIFTYTADYPEK
jgi:Plavaka transposase